MKVSGLKGAQLDRWVAKAEGLNLVICENGMPILGEFDPYKPSTKWEQGGPIIERGLIMIEPVFECATLEHPEGSWNWSAYVLGPTNQDDSFEQHGPTPLIAAMRCYVASKFGEDV